MPKTTVDPNLIAGISLNENPQADVWLFKKEKPYRRVGHYKLNSIISDLGIDIADTLQDSLLLMLQAIMRDHAAVSLVGVALPGNVSKDDYKVENIARLGISESITIRLREKGLFDPRESKVIFNPITSMENDVTCLALGAYALDYAGMHGPFAYIYVDRGVNVGVVIGGTAYRGVLHPELGHLTSRMDLYPGSARTDSSCLYHENCLEALISRPAIEAQWPNKMNAILDDLPRFKKHHRFIADGISQLAEVVTMCFAPRKILIGGYPTDKLLSSTRQRFEENTQGYPIYKDRFDDLFIEKSPYPPDGLFALGAAIQAYNTAHDEEYNDGNNN